MAIQSVELGTGSGGAKIAVDNDGTNDHQYVKLEFGPDNTQTIVTASVGLPINAISAVYSYVDDADWTDDTSEHVLTGGVYQSSPQTITDGDTGPIQVTTNGYVIVSVNGTLTVASHAVTNAGTFAVQSTLQAGTAEFGKLAAGTAEIGNVKNAGTFATQATLQAGTAEVGKLAAGTAEIGNVKNAGTFAVQSTLQAGTAEFGKLAAGTAAIGKLAPNSGIDIGDVDVTSTVHPKPATSGGFNAPFYDKDLDEAAIAVKATAGQVYRIFAFNTTAATLYLQIWNTAQGSVTVGTTTPITSLPIPPNDSGITLDFDSGWEFGTAITVACTTGAETNGAPATNACLCHIWFE